MRLRYYLRGLGLGILFAVIIIAICGKGTEGSLSDSQIMQRASELGMVSTENVKNHTLSNDTEAVKKENVQDTEPAVADNSTGNNAATSNNAATDNNAATGNNAAKDNNAATDNAKQGQPADSQAQGNQAETQNSADASTALQPEAGSTPTETQYVTITVMDGEVCRDIAADLQSKGLVDDAEKFRIYMGETGYASFIHNGHFQIPVGASYEEIANILLRK